LRDIEGEVKITAQSGTADQDGAPTVAIPAAVIITSGIPLRIPDIVYDRTQIEAIAVFLLKNIGYCRQQSPWQVGPGLASCRAGGGAGSANRMQHAVVGGNIDQGLSLLMALPERVVTHAGVRLWRRSHQYRVAVDEGAQGKPAEVFQPLRRGLGIRLPEGRQLSCHRAVDGQKRFAAGILRESEDAAVCQILRSQLLLYAP